MYSRSAKGGEKGDPNRNFLTVELHRSFLYSFFQEKTLGDISFELVSEIMNFMSVFFYQLILYNGI
jgi:hypothetical protein